MVKKFNFGEFASDVSKMKPDVLQRVLDKAPVNKLCKLYADRCSDEDLERLFVVWDKRGKVKNIGVLLKLCLKKGKKVPVEILEKYK